MTTGGAGGKPYILVYGVDIALLRTRKWVLETGCFKVMLAGMETEIEVLLRSCSFALFILCHSLSANARNQALTTAARVSPETRRLLLTTGPAPHAEAPCDAIFNAMDGPEAFLDLVRGMTAAQPGQSPSLHIVARRK